MITPVFILSDFGAEDTYTAQMKAAILSFAGYDTPVIDLTPNVGRGNVLHGAFHLRAALPHLPEGSVTLAVVDPGVGTDRLGLAAMWRGRYLVAPDNGLVSLLPGPVSLWKLPPVERSSSNTFHGRDYFAPCAARLSVDPCWTESLEPHGNPVLLPLSPVEPCPEGLAASVLHTDHFGNCILSLTPEQVAGVVVTGLIASGGTIPLRTVRCYADDPSGRELLFLSGSQGFMEIALSGGSAAEILHLTPGMDVLLAVKENEPI